MNARAARFQSRKELRNHDRKVANLATSTRTSSRMLWIKLRSWEVLGKAGRKQREGKCAGPALNPLKGILGSLSLVGVHSCRCRAKLIALKTSRFHDRTPRKKAPAMKFLRSGPAPKGRLRAPRHFGISYFFQTATWRYRWRNFY